MSWCICRCSSRNVVRLFPQPAHWWVIERRALNKTQGTNRGPASSRESFGIKWFRTFTCDFKPTWDAEKGQWASYCLNEPVSNLTLSFSCRCVIFTVIIDNGKIIKKWKLLWILMKMCLYFLKETVSKWRRWSAVNKVTASMSVCHSSFCGVCCDESDLCRWLFSWFSMSNRRWTGINYDVYARQMTVNSVCLCVFDKFYCVVAEDLFYDVLSGLCVWWWVLCVYCIVAL